MTDNSRQRLTLVASDGAPRTKATEAMTDREGAESRDLDWTILMARAQDGDTFAYLRLLEEIAPYLRSLVRRWHKDPWDIEDTVQDILLTLHSIRHTYDPTRPFGPWLVGIANRRAIDRLRRLGRQTRREAPLGPEHEETASTSDNMEGIFDQHRLAEAIDTLPPLQQQAVDLLKLKEMSLKEVSDTTGVSIGSLKMATHRALRTLQTLLSDRRDS